MSIGRKTIVWGQLNAVSPVDIVLPIRFQSQGLAFNKAGNRIPQDVAILSLYPTENIEIEGYYFPKATFDKNTADALKDFTSRQGENDIAFINNNGNFIDFREGEMIKLRLPNTFNDLGQDYQVAGRLIFYLDFMTIGFTYFNGFYTFNTADNARLLNRVEDPEPPQAGELPRVLYNYTLEPSMYKAHTLGLELAIPVQEWAVKIESALSTRKEDIDRPTDSLSRNAFQRERQEALIDWIINSNNSSLSIDYYELISGIGLDADLDRWVFNLLLLNVTHIYGENAQRVVETLWQQKKRSAVKEGAGPPPPAIPFFNIGWYTSPDKKATLGILGGFLGTIGFGASVYITQKLFDDDFRWAISLDAISFSL